MGEQEREHGQREGATSRPPSIPSVSVVIRTYTEARWDHLVAAVASVRAQTIPLREIVVVVDYEPRLLDRALRDLQDAIVVGNHCEQGASGSLNSGIAATGGAIVALLDDDAVAAPDWLEKLVAPYRDEQVLGVGGEIIPVWAAGRPDWFPVEFYWVVGCTYRGLPKQTAPVRNLIGANMSFRRTVWESVDGFRSSVGAVGGSMLRGEEAEFCIRVSQRWRGHLWLYEPSARVYHHQAEDRAQWGYFRSICYGQGLTKAQIVRLLGTRDGLDSERSYTFRTLPTGVLGNIGHAFRHLDPAGFSRAYAILAGLFFTASGYVVGAGKLAFSSSAQVVSAPVADPTAAASETLSLE